MLISREISPRALQSSKVLINDACPSNPMGPFSELEVLTGGDVGLFFGGVRQLGAGSDWAAGGWQSANGGEGG